MDLAAILDEFNDMLYTWLLIYLLTGSGIYFTVRTRFVQIRRLKDAFRCMLEKKADDGIGNFFYAEANILFITENKAVMTIFRIAAALMVFIGACNSMDTAWNLAEITMGLEAVVNIIAILLLGGIAFRALGDYERQAAMGIDPVFHESNIGLSDTYVWK